jgi:hypothetical protein
MLPFSGLNVQPRQVSRNIQQQDDDGHSVRRFRYSSIRDDCMAAKVQHEDRFANVEIDLKNPALAAFLAWLWPGAGHLYQRRIGKGILYMACILVTYFFGLAMGDGHVVYASWGKPKAQAGEGRVMVRYPYLCQIGVGLPALPALAQKFAADRGGTILDSDLMAPPGDTYEQRHDKLATWHEKLGFYFELGTLYTMIAGLLNMLVIFDAYSGPVFADPRGHGKDEDENGGNRKAGEASGIKGR